MGLHFVRDQNQFYSAIYVMSDHDSELGQRFRYLFRAETEFELPDHLTYRPYSLLLIAAYLGDLEFLNCLEELYGGVLYDSLDIRVALNYGHFEFFFKYLELSKAHLLQLEAGGHVGRYETLHEVLWVLNISEHDQLCAFRYVYDHFLPSLPPMEDLGQYLTLGPDFRPWDLVLLQESLLDRIIQSDRRLHYGIIRFLVENRGLRFSDSNLQMASRCHRERLYNYVLDHLKPALDRDLMQKMHPLQATTDVEFVEQISASFAGYVLAQEDDLPTACAAHRENLAELMFGNPVLISKAVYLVRFLASPQCLNDRELLETFCQKLIDQRNDLFFVLNAKNYVTEMADWLRDILMDKRFPWLTNIDWSLEAFVDVSQFANGI